MLEEIEKNIQTTLDIHAPLITVNCKSKFEPWITTEISDKQKEADYLYRRYKRNKSDERLSLYRESTNSLSHLINNTKATFYRNRLYHLSKSNHIWSELKNLGLVDSSSSVELNFSPDLLNTYFSSVQCSDDSEAIPPIFNIHVYLLGNYSGRS